MTWKVLLMFFLAGGCLGYVGGYEMARYVARLGREDER
jgi:hypothetical protein